MASYNDFVKGTDENYRKHKLFPETPTRPEPGEPQFSYPVNSEHYSHLTSTDIPQPKGKIYHGNR